jgi:Chaperone of endosialidase
MGVPYTFSTASQSIPLAQLDANFATPIVLGSSTAALGQTVTTLNNLTLSNVTILSGTATLNNLTGNVTFGNTTVNLGNSSSSIGNLTLNNTTINSGNSTVFNMTYTGALTGGTGVVNLGSNQFYKDTNGNVGYGVIPSAWNSSAKAIQVNTRGVIYEFSGNIGIGNNYYIDGSSFNKYLTTNPASAYLQDATGNHVWYTAPSGTAGTNATLTARTSVNSQGHFTVGNNGVAIVSNSEPFVQVVNNFAGGQFICGQTGSLFWNFGRDNVTTGYFVFGFNGTQVSYINNSTGVYTAISDKRLKKNITPLQYGLKEVLALNPVMYNMKTEDDDKKKHIGLIAQEVKIVIDELVEDIDETKQSYGLSATEIVPVLIKAIQELNGKIQTLEAKIGYSNNI